MVIEPLFEAKICHFETAWLCGKVDENDELYEQAGPAKGGGEIKEEEVFLVPGAPVYFSLYFAEQREKVEREEAAAASGARERDDRSAEARLPNLRGDRARPLRRRPPLRAARALRRALIRRPLPRRQVHRQVRRLRRRPRLPLPPHGAQGDVPPLPAPEPPPHPQRLRGLLPPPPRPRPLRLPRPPPRRRLLRPPPGARGRPDPRPADACRRPLPPPRRRPPGHQAREHTLRLPGAAEARGLRLRGGDRGRGAGGGAEGGGGDAALRGAGGGGGEGVRGEGGRVERRGGAVRDARGVPAVPRGERGGDIRGGAEGEPEVPAAGLPVCVGGGEGSAQDDAVQGRFPKALCRSSPQDPPSISDLLKHPIRASMGDQL